MPVEIKDISSVDAESFPYVVELHVAIPLKSSTGHVRCNVYRPKGSETHPVLVTYGPYGKDIPYKEWFTLSFYCQHH